MKTFEQMAQNVLKRRDEELKRLNDARKSAEYYEQSKKAPPAAKSKGKTTLKIALPCAAVIAAAFTGIAVYRYYLAESKLNVHSPYSGGDLYNSDGTELSDGTISIAPELVIYPTAPEWFDNCYQFSNINANGNIVYNNVEIPVNECQHISFTNEEMYEYYGVDIHKLNDILLPDSWSLNDPDFGIYTYSPKDSNSPFTKPVTVDTANVVSYSYNPLANNTFVFVGVEKTHYVLPSVILNAEDQSMAEPYSSINGYKVMAFERQDNSGFYNYCAFIEMNSIVMIESIGLSEQDFIYLLNYFTSE